MVIGGGSNPPPLVDVTQQRASTRYGRGRIVCSGKQEGQEFVTLLSHFSSRIRPLSLSHLVPRTSRHQIAPRRKTRGKPKPLPFSSRSARSPFRFFENDQGAERSLPLLASRTPRLMRALGTAVQIGSNRRLQPASDHNSRSTGLCRYPPAPCAGSTMGRDTRT